QQQQQQKDSETYTELLRYRSQEFYNKLAQQQQRFHPSSGRESSSSCSNRTNETIYDTSSYNHVESQQQKLYNSQSLINVQQLESDQNLMTLPLQITTTATTQLQQQRRLTKEFESLRNLSIPPTSSITDDDGIHQSHHYQNSLKNNSIISQNRNPSVYSNHLKSSTSLLRSNSSLSLSHHQRNKGYLQLHSGQNLLPTLSSTNLSLSLMPSSTTSTSTSSSTTTAATNGFAALATIDRRLTTSRNVIGASALLPLPLPTSSSPTTGLQHAYSYQQAKVAQHIVHNPDHNCGISQVNQPQLKRTLAIGGTSTNSVSAPTTPQKALLSRSNSSNPTSSTVLLQPVPIQQTSLYPTNNNLPQSTIFGHPQHYSSNHLSNVSLNQRHASSNINNMNISRSSNSLITSGNNNVTANGNHQQTINVPDHHLYHSYGTVVVPPNVIAANNNSVNQHYISNNVGKFSQNQQTTMMMVQPHQKTLTKFNSNNDQCNNGGLTVITPCS
ncbi:hypothetical protein BLA29_004161, partial [Euroglyphus maynei]